MNKAILSVNKLSKSYGTTIALNEISFDVQKESFFAFLGRNGAGKSTTIKIIAGLLKQDSGTFNLDSNNDIRKDIGIVFQENVLDALLTVKENLLTRGFLYFCDKDFVTKRYLYLLEKLELKEIENQIFKTLSGGQKRRVEIARALFSQPKLLILDEPTTGLDPESRGLVWKIIQNLKVEEKITIFLTTHYMEEASWADEVIIIDKGEIVAKGTPAILKEKYSKDYFKLVPLDEVSLIKELNKLDLNYKKFADQYHVAITSTNEAIELIIKLKDNIKTFEVVNGTLDDVFIKVVGEDHDGNKSLSSKKY